MLLILLKGKRHNHLTLGEGIKNVLNERSEPSCSFTAPTISTDRERKEPSLLHDFPQGAHTSDRVFAVTLNESRETYENSGISLVLSARTALREIRD